MTTHPHLQIQQLPSLRDAVLVVAWGGWTDAGEAATRAARYLAASLDAVHFASIDPEEYCDFTESRPYARYRHGEREIVWPSTDFYHAGGASLPRPLVIGVGVEPNHRWRSYLDALAEIVASCEVKLVISLAAVAAAVPHTQPTRVWGAANTAALAKQYGMRPPTYEGPTGIVGVFHDHCRRDGVPALSLWATVPHYLNLTNPLATTALLERLQEILHYPFKLDYLRREVTQFEHQVREVLEDDDRLRAYVRQLEQAEPDEEPVSDLGQELPSAERLISELEEFLRGHRDAP